MSQWSDVHNLLHACLMVSAGWLTGLLLSFSARIAHFSCPLFSSGDMLFVFDTAN